jgi:hypothetical protein
LGIVAGDLSGIDKSAQVLLNLHWNRYRWGVCWMQTKAREHFDIHRTAVDILHNFS